MVRVCVFKFVATFSISVLVSVETAKILCLLPIPQKSHQIAFRPIIEELLRRKHEIDVLTVDPSYPKGQTPPNLTEIDIHDISYSTWTEKYIKADKKDTLILQYKNIFETFNGVVKKQFASDQIQNVMKNGKSYDIIKGDTPFSSYGLIFSHVFNVPLLGITTTVASLTIFDTMGVSKLIWHYQPRRLQKILADYTYVEMFKAVYYDYAIYNFYAKCEIETYETVKSKYLPDIPPLSKLKKNIHAVLTNNYLIWDGVKPFPPNCASFKVKISQQVIPQDIQSYLDSSKNGVIYASFGTNIMLSLLPKHTISIILGVFSRLPYDVLLKSDNDELPGCPENVKLFKWLPQPDVLKHPKIKLFITQGGQHSIDEAIEAEVPMLVVPTAIDQYAHSERCVYHGIGAKLDLKTMSEESLMNAIKILIEDKRYRENIVKLRTILQDTPLKSMDRLMWTIEYIIRHGGANHLRSPSAEVSSSEFFELELLCICFSIFFVIILSVVKVLMIVKKCVFKMLRKSKVDVQLDLYIAREKQL